MSRVADWTEDDLASADAVRRLNITPAAVLDVTEAEAEELAAWAAQQGWTVNIGWATAEGRQALAAAEHAARAVTPHPAPTPPAAPSPGVGTPGTAETGSGPREPDGGDEATMAWAYRRIAALEAVNAAKDELLADLWLYLDWRYVTRQLTTEQKRLLADAIDDDYRRRGEVPVAERWWDWPSCEVCRQPVEERDGRWYDLRCLPGQTEPIDWAGVGLTPAHAHHTSAAVQAEPGVRGV